MEHQDSVTTAVPNSFTPAVPASVHRRDIIVCALAAPGNPGPGPLPVNYKRRTFWTACASCKKKNKYSIEYLDCNISCIHCCETFKANEVSRPRNQHTTTTENVHSAAIVTSPGTLVGPSEMTPTVETPLPNKRVKRDNIVTQAVGKLKRSFNANEIRRLMISKGKNMVTEGMNRM